MATKYAVFWGCQIPSRLPFFEKSIRLVLEQIGIEIIDLPGFTCCPEKTLVKSYSEDTWLLTAARNLAVAEASGLPLLTPCNGCYSTLKTVSVKIKDSVDLKERVSSRLREINLDLKGSIVVKHLVEVLHDDVGPAKISRQVKHPLVGMRIAVHYGCHLIRPSAQLRFDDPIHPEKLDTLVRALGAEPCSYDTKMLCCGSGLGFAGAQEDATMLMRKKLLDIRDRADALTLVCPACFIQYDQRQFVLQRQGEQLGIPVFGYQELLGLALGLSGDALGLGEHRVKTDDFIRSWRERMSINNRIKEHLDLAALKKCYSCGACLDDCPVAQLDGSFQPREVIGDLLKGNLAGLFQNQTIWQCLECHTCSELCPQKFGMEKVFIVLKGMASEQGCAPSPIQGGIKTFLKTARLGAVDDKARKKLGLEALPPGGEAELRKLLGLTGQEDGGGYHERN